MIKLMPTLLNVYKTKLCYLFDPDGCINLFPFFLQMFNHKRDIINDLNLSAISKLSQYF